MIFQRLSTPEFSKISDTVVKKKKKLAMYSKNLKKATIFKKWHCENISKNNTCYILENTFWERLT